MSFDQMLDETFKTIHNGEVVEGTVLAVKPDEIILNIGYKSDGILTRSEYTNDNSVDLTTVLHPGDPLEVKVLKVNKENVVMLELRVTRVQQVTLVPKALLVLEVLLVLKVYLALQVHKVQKVFLVQKVLEVLEDILVCKVHKV